MRDDDIAAAAVGKDVFGYRMQAMALGAAIAGFSGLLLAWQLGLFNPLDFLPIITFYAYIIIVVGGLGRTWAIPVGALLFGLLDAATRFLGFWPLSEVASGDRAFLRQLDRRAGPDRPDDVPAAGTVRQAAGDELWTLSKPCWRCRVSVSRSAASRAVSDVSVSIPEGSLAAIIGPNGAGKTTLFNVVSGCSPATAAARSASPGTRSSASAHTRSRVWASPAPSRCRARSRA